MLWLITLAILAGSAPVSAQEADAGDAARFKLGVLRFTPSIAITDVGVDTNVFNESVDPKQDQTGAAGPAVDLWIHLGRSRLSGTVSGQYLYFKQYRTQRAWNTIDSARWEVPMTRLRPFIEGTYANTKARPGYEIDSRARQAAQSVSIGTDVRFSSRTTVVLSSKRARIAFDDTETFAGVALATALNTITNSEQLELRYKLTTLTTFSARAEAIQDRFVSEPFRNADSIRILPGFELKPAALISGKVFVGYRRFSPLSPLVPRFQGPVAAVDATFTARRTQFHVNVSRDVAFSYQVTQPYYVLADVGVGITQRLARSWDVIVRGGRQTLDYTRVRSSALTELPGQVDTIRQYGGGIGYRLGQTLRLGFDGLYLRRHSSDVALRDYEGARFGASIALMVPQ